MKIFKKKQPPVDGNEQTPAIEPLLPRWGNLRTWANLFLLFFTLEIAVYSVEQAKWITPQPSLTLVLIFSVIFIYLLTAARLRGWLLHIVAAAAGVLVVLWQGTALLPDGQGAGRLFSIFGSWMSGEKFQPGEGQVIFGILLVLLTWVAGYLSTWFVLRKHNAWAAVIFGVTVLLVNLSNLPAKDYIFFIVFLVFAVLLIIMTRIVRQQSVSGQTSGYSSKSILYLIVSVLCVTTLAVSVSWVMPQWRIPALQDAIATGMPWTYSVRESGFNVLNSIPSKKSVSTAARMQDLDFGRFWNSSNEIKFIVSSAQPAYWQVIVYDIYHSGSWESSLAVEEPKEKETEWGNAPDTEGRTRLKYKVTSGINTDALLLTGDFESSEMPVVASLGIENEVVAVRSPRVLSPGESYTIRAYVSDASEEELTAASGNYTDVIKAAFLQLPSTLPEEVVLLSENITLDSKTPYDKVMAIDRYLSTIPYTLEVDELPEGEDAVADFLFTQKKGFCMHFASAMTVMLRSVGVPSRLVVGYLPGDPGKEQGEYILRDKHYHAWTQVYFPDYGWINFEPTPASQRSQVPLDTTRVSVPDISQMEIWNAWYTRQMAEQGGSGEMPMDIPAVTKVINVQVSYADELGIVIAVLAGAALLYGLFLVIVRIIGKSYSGRLWHVDRENLASSAYANLCRLAAMENISPGPQQTPLEFSSRVAELIPEQASNLEYIIRSYMDKRFGPSKEKPGLYEEAEILKARVIVYNAMLRRKGFIGRLMGRSESS